MSPRTGRPKEENPNTTNLTIRINTLLSQRLTDYCQKHNTTKGKVVRDGLEKVLGEKNK